MRTWKVRHYIGLFFTILVAAILVVAVITKSNATDREEKIAKVSLGTKKSEVDRLLGTATSVDNNATCPLPCPRDSQRHWYKGNPSLWYGHFEDSLRVCYKDGRVCFLARVGL